MSAFIYLKSGNKVAVNNFTHINYPDGKGETVTVKEFDNFYLYDRLLTFVGANNIITISSADILFVQFVTKA